MTRSLSVLLRPVTLIPAGTAVIAAAVWLLLPAQEDTPRSDLTAVTIADTATSDTAFVTPQASGDDPQAAWLAYQQKAKAVLDAALTPADKQYYKALHVAVCQKISEARAQQVAFKPVALPAEVQAEFDEQDKMCSNVKETDSKTARAMMQQAADAGQKDAQLYLLREDAQAAGMMLISDNDPTKPQSPLTAEERAQRESIVGSLQALANTGHREALITLADVKMRAATGKSDYATSFAMTLIGYLDWSKPLPASEADEAMMNVPQELRAEVLLRMQELYRECCATAPNKDRYTAALDSLGPPPPEATVQASMEPRAGNFNDIFRVQRN